MSNNRCFLYVNYVFSPNFLNIRIAFKEQKIQPAIRNKQDSDKDDTSNDDSSEYNMFYPQFKISKRDMQFELNIKDIELFDNKNTDMKLRSEWSDTLNEIVWEYSRTPCAWVFQKQKNLANETAVYGACRSVHCNASLIVYTENNRTKLKIVIKSFNPKSQHTEKRRVKGTNRDKIIVLLKQNKPLHVHAQLANQMLHKNDHNPAHLPNLVTLRKMKQRENDKHRLDVDPIRSLCIMKTESAYLQCITDIGIDPFYCIFYTPEQKQWLRLGTRNSRCIISIDSTGKYIQFYSVLCSYLFLFVSLLQPNRRTNPTTTIL